MTNNPTKLLVELTALRIMLIGKGATGRPADIVGEAAHRLEQLDSVATASQALLDALDEQHPDDIAHARYQLRRALALQGGLR
jgi:hypothetical protein